MSRLSHRWPMNEAKAYEKACTDTGFVEAVIKIGVTPEEEERLHEIAAKAYNNFLEVLRQNKELEQ